MLNFPEGFVWGAATSSYQIEGATTEDGRGESIWDRFCKTPGKVTNGENGDIACDHYHRWREDIALMASLGLQAYRFSIAWPRVLPGGDGPLNTVGLDFYDRLVDALLEAGIAPWATLYHWDLPQALQDRGGWPSRTTAEAFVHYADVVSRRLGDRVSGWITHNEPWVASMVGHQLGLHAPGIADWSAALAASHHLLLSHGLAVPVIRANAPGVPVGITLNLCPAVPASSSSADAEATRWFDGWFNRWFLDPLYSRGYPADMLADHTAAGHITDGKLPFLLPGDLETIATETDFLGVNYYNRGIIRSDRIPEAENAPREVFKQETTTDLNWEVYPEGLLELLTRLQRDYAPGRLYITENGAAYDTGPDEDGRIRDVRRQEYIHGHLAACHQAIADGIPLAGYFAWSLMDNFEWAYGYDKRFGLVWVDYTTQERICKDSALWFRDVISSNGVLDLQ